MRISSLGCLVVTTALAAALLGCGEELGPNGEQLVDIVDDSFDPTSKSIDTGDNVLWEWMGSNQHNVTWVVPAGAANSATQTSGTFTRAFTAAGTYEYYCTIHGTATTGMRGRIVVQ